jgi:hypothetical protein
MGDGEPQPGDGEAFHVRQIRMAASAFAKKGPKSEQSQQWAAIVLFQKLRQFPGVDLPLDGEYNGHAIGIVDYRTILVVHPVSD